MSVLVFLDTETTGLSLDDDIWEFAAIRREPDGSETATHLFIEHSTDKCSRLPESFRADHSARYDAMEAVTPHAAAHYINHVIFNGRPHVVGAVPNFDTERIARLLARFRYLPPWWHHHLIDVEALAVGYLAAAGLAALWLRVTRREPPPRPPQPFHCRLDEPGVDYDVEVAEALAISDPVALERLRRIVGDGSET